MTCTCCGGYARGQCVDHDTGYGVCDSCLKKHGRQAFCMVDCIEHGPAKAHAIQCDRCGIQTGYHQTYDTPCTLEHKSLCKTCDKCVFSHAFDIAFELDSAKEDGSDVTAEQIREAIYKRVRELDDRELVNEAVGAPYDTYCRTHEGYTGECFNREIETKPASKLYHGLTPYRFSFINPETGTRNYWIRFYDDMNVALDDSKEACLKEYPKAHSFLIELDQDSEEIRKSWGLPY